MFRINEPDEIGIQRNQDQIGSVETGFWICDPHQGLSNYDAFGCHHEPRYKDLLTLTFCLFLTVTCWHIKVWTDSARTNVLITRHEDTPSWINGAGQRGHWDYFSFASSIIKTTHWVDRHVRGVSDGWMGRSVGGRTIGWTASKTVRKTLESCTSRLQSFSLCFLDRDRDNNPTCDIFPSAPSSGCGWASVSWLLMDVRGRGQWRQQQVRHSVCPRPTHPLTTHSLPLSTVSTLIFYRSCCGASAPRRLSLFWPCCAPVQQCVMTDHPEGIKASEASVS